MTDDVKLIFLLLLGVWILGGFIGPRTTTSSSTSNTSPITRTTTVRANDAAASPSQVPEIYRKTHRTDIDNTSDFSSTASAYQASPEETHRLNTRNMDLDNTDDDNIPYDPQRYYEQAGVRY